MKKEKDHKLYRKMGFYERYIKRAIDIFCSGLAIIVFCWLYAIIALLVRIKLGSPVLFTQYRPGLIDPKTGKERIFKMYKFRTMTDKKDAEGNLLPDEIRLTKFGAWLRATSLDELPEAFCILNGTMTLIGPRPQDRKLQYDLEYIEHVSFGRDLKILFKTVEKAFIKQEGITEEGSVTAADYGDYLLQTKQISKEEYDKKQNEAKELLKGLK